MLRDRRKRLIVSDADLHSFKKQNVWDRVMEKVNTNMRKRKLRRLSLADSKKIPRGGGHESMRERLDFPMDIMRPFQAHDSTQPVEVDPHSISSAGESDHSAVEQESSSNKRPSASIGIEERPVDKRKKVIPKYFSKPIEVDVVETKNTNKCSV